jgi:hypothetical protein
MPRHLYEIAKECAHDAVSVAQCGGHDVKTSRALFFSSDVSNLADMIHVWLEAHMEPQRT